MSMKERTKAKQVIVEIVRQAKGKFTGKTRLFKAFYVLTCSTRSRSANAVR
jgi:hypothetical protein